jgi:hypothetical protein
MITRKIPSYFFVDPKPRLESTSLIIRLTGPVASKREGRERRYRVRPTVEALLGDSG